MRKLLVLGLVFACSCTEESIVIESQTPPLPTQFVVAHTESVWVQDKTIIASLAASRQAKDVVLVATSPVRDSFPLLPYWKDANFDYFQNNDRNNAATVELRFRHSVTGAPDTIQATVKR
ncbi:MAG: hypothetical protein ACE5EO_10485 [Candidatus Krumholzibacteriia bacterium]